MNLLTFFFISIFGLGLFMLVRYVLFRFGYKDSNYPLVQQVDRKAKAKNTEELFLPGSRSDSLDIEEAIATSKKVQAWGKNKKKRGRFSIKELKNALILEDLLHPKYKHIRAHEHDRHREEEGEH